MEHRSGSNIRSYSSNNTNLPKEKPLAPPQLLWGVKGLHVLLLRGHALLFNDAQYLFDRLAWELGRCFQRIAECKHHVDLAVFWNVKQ